MKTTQWNTRVLGAIKSGLSQDAESALLAILANEWEDPSDDRDALWVVIFGERKECPHCGQGIFGGFLCWSCEGWTAPE